MYACLASLIFHHDHVSFSSSAGWSLAWLTSHDPWRFFGWNWYRLGVGVHYDLGCTAGIEKSRTLVLANQDINETVRNTYYVSSEDDNQTVFIMDYPCEWGFHYLTSGAAVWLAFLPFYITQLLGNCWRQCCCCLCDPLVNLSRICRGLHLINSYSLFRCALLVALTS